MNYEKNRKELIEEMQDTFGYIYCQHCNRSSGVHKFHSHHIFFRSEFPKHKNLHHKSNLLILCSLCHDKFHSDKSIRDKYVIDRNLKQLFE